MKIKNVTVCGAGVLGTQIAFQTSFHKFNVILYDISEEPLEKAKAKFKSLSEVYKTNLHATQQQVDQTISRITFSTDFKEATKDADLIIEAIPENAKIKKKFYVQLGKIAPVKSIFCTNSSTLLPSMFAQETGRPERFLALHFANNIWKLNTAEIMGHKTTDPKVFDTIVEFAKAIGMIALPIYKEQPGYILNSLLVPFIRSAMALYVNDISDPATIDKTWMKASGAPIGPFGICDIVGITTIYNINKMAADTKDAHAQKVVKMLQENFIDKGKLGVPTGEGFYSYPNPAYESADFLKQ
ncbi:3-hydroxyacyl-CoA dehydrogenase [Aquimarina megaterium]|uniref:3-hydroxyacyl-CoA dehydrogenase n=1 Tax=Aquimarina megaterium TaxID=1443666 RepID=UPI000944C907|nr:3-hydroxyacyl-CoA dehydrogenase [Aquimarina megaterium]